MDRVVRAVQAMDSRQRQQLLLEVVNVQVARWLSLAFAVLVKAPSGVRLLLNWGGPLLSSTRLFVIERVCRSVSCSNTMGLSAMSVTLN